MRNKHTLHISTDFLVLSHFWYERDNTAVPFECRFMSQSLFVNVTVVYHKIAYKEKFIIFKASLFGNRSGNIFCSSWT